MFCKCCDAIGILVDDKICKDFLLLLDDVFGLGGKKAVFWYFGSKHQVLAFASIRTVVAHVSFVLVFGRIKNHFKEVFLFIFVVR